MKTDWAANELETRATEALKSLLGQVSAVKLKEMKRESQGRSGTAKVAAHFLAHIDIYGHSHILACEVNADTRPGKVRSSIRKLQECAAHLAGETTPVFIAPYLSPESQALCKQNQAGFLDLEGNARLSLGEVFIGKRSMNVQQPVA
jgi:hypothetical protein